TLNSDPNLLCAKAVTSPPEINTSPVPQAGQASLELMIVFGINHGLVHGDPAAYFAASATACAATLAVSTPKARAKYVFCVDWTSTVTRRLAGSGLTVTSDAAIGWPIMELLRATWSALS